jgi:hypothetical protein
MSEWPPERITKLRALLRNAQNSCGGSRLISRLQIDLNRRPEGGQRDKVNDHQSLARHGRSSSRHNCSSNDPRRAARIEEYRELAEGLELEIVTALQSPPPGTKHELR